MSDLTRRSFVGLATATAAGVMATSALASEAAAPEAAETLETEVLVVGIGASGFQCALGAAKLGAKVLAIDLAESMVGTTNITTSGYLCVGDKLQLEQPFHFEIPEIYTLINQLSNYCFNTQVLKALLEASSRSSNNMIDAGVTVGVVELPERIELTGPTLGQRCGHPYKISGQERADCFENALLAAGVEIRYGIEAKELIWEGDEIKGVRCEADGAIVDIMAGAICLCTGGFLGNEEMVAKYFAGSRIVPMGNKNCKGAGINMALSAGAQMGKSFSLSSNEYGGANFLASPTFAFRPGTGSNEALRFILLGSILVDSMGDRFVSEQIANKEAMHCAEPFIRAKTYYTVVDQDFIDYVSVTPLGQIMGDGRMKTMFAEVIAENIEEDFDEAIAEGWAAKADTIAELAEAFNLPNLEATVEQYNQYCDEGYDALFYNDPEFMHKLQTPPFYIVQSFPAGWLSLGGVKCDAKCHALDPDNRPIDKLYIAGADADLFCAPYIAGGSANGFAQASGLIAGESAAMALGYGA
ncbi:MAG: FAD-binding protein [Coriobacteriales bacterium]|nr:FAD-binding protein [Coriobacteriales bacterium]